MRIEDPTVRNPITYDGSTDGDASSAAAAGAESSVDVGNSVASARAPDGGRGVGVGHSGRA
jgi:hypothetical protein